MDRSFENKPLNLFNIYVPTRIALISFNVNSSNSIVFEQATMCYITHLFYRNIQHMALSDQELKEIAYLARINVNEESLTSLKKELEDILGLFEELNEADTSQVSAMSHPLDLSQPTRKDEVTEENLREELLKNAPSV